jgi:hypothetical protein
MRRIDPIQRESGLSPSSNMVTEIVLVRAAYSRMVADSSRIATTGDRLPCFTITMLLNTFAMILLINHFTARRST